MKLTGIVKTWDAKEWLGTIESDGKSFILRRDGFKRGTKIVQGATVSFNFSIRRDGATASDAEIVLQDSPKQSSRNFPPG